MIALSLALALQVSRRQAGLAQDAEALQKAYTTMHPGLYRYNSPAQIEADFAQLISPIHEVCDGGSGA